MLRLLSIHVCRDCPQNAGLIKAAEDQGETVAIEPLLRDTPETLWAARNGLGLPLLVRADGSVSDNAIDWLSPEIAPQAPIEETVIEEPAKPTRRRASK